MCKATREEIGFEKGKERGGWLNEYEREWIGEKTHSKERDQLRQSTGTEP